MWKIKFLKQLIVHFTSFIDVWNDDDNNNDDDDDNKSIYTSHYMT